MNIMLGHFKESKIIPYKMNSPKNKHRKPYDSLSFLIPEEKNLE